VTFFTDIPYLRDLLIHLLVIRVSVWIVIGDFERAFLENVEIVIQLTVINNHVAFLESDKQHLTGQVDEVETLRARRKQSCILLQKPNGLGRISNWFNGLASGHRRVLLLRVLKYCFVVVRASIRYGRTEAGTCLKHLVEHGVACMACDRFFVL